MQIKTYAIPIIGGEQMNEEMNAFLRSKKVLQLESHIVTHANNAFWSFCIKYVEDAAILERERVKVDYKQVLDEAAFKRFSRLREIRKQLANDDSVPAYAVFTDEELSGVAKLDEITLVKLKSVKGIGDKKIEKYGSHFIKAMSHETN
jgi:superfamily II DNA helicase RecQ